MRSIPFAAGLIVLLVTATTALAAITFNGNFDTGLTPWTSQAGGGAQCANYGTPSKSPRYRGNLYFDSINPGQGIYSGKFYLPIDPDPTTYPLEACDIITGKQPFVNGADQYLGLMVRVPSTTTYMGSWGTEIAGYHDVGVVSSPLEIVAFSDRIEVQLLGGACNPSIPSCTYSAAHGYPHKSIIPTGTYVEGSWYEIITHVHWSTTTSGVVQTWYRQKGATTWTASAGYTNVATEQWRSGYPLPSVYVDQLEAYTQARKTPLTIWLDNDVYGTTFSDVAATMP
jgi:hypothetical protein